MNEKMNKRMNENEWINERMKERKKERMYGNQASVDDQPPLQLRVATILNEETFSIQIRETIFL